MAPNAFLLRLYRLYQWLHAPIARSWFLSRLWYRLFAVRLEGGPDDRVWYFAFGANMDESVLRGRRGIVAREWRAARLADYRLRFNLEGHPRGRAAPANIEPAPDSEVWGVAYDVTQRELVWLDHTEAVPVWQYRHLWIELEDRAGKRLAPAVTYIARGHEADGRPSRRYLRLLRNGARAHDLPDHWIRFLDGVTPAD